MNDHLTPSQELIEQWCKAARPYWLLNDLAAKAASWGYSQCQAEYERAAMDLVEPTWLDDDDDLTDQPEQTA